MLIQKRIKQIQALTGITQRDFQSLYLTTIERFLAYSQPPNHPTARSGLVDLLDSVIVVLKRRRGLLLPLGADSETSFREREEWTFAVFSAVLLQPIELVARFAVAKAILPSEGYAWLHRNTVLFTAWQCYLQGDSQKNVFADIVGGIVFSCEAHGKTQGKSPKNSIKELAEAKKADLIERVSEPQKYVLPKNASIQEIDLNVLPNHAGKQRQEAKEPPEKSEQTPATKINLPSFNAASFWDWLKQAILDQAISVNQVDSMVHRVTLGLFVKIPEAIDAFLKEQAQAHSIISHDDLFKQRPALTKAIKQCEKLVRNTQGSRIHIYCIGKWEERRTLSGVVIEAGALLSAKQVIPINEALTPDPLSHV